MLPRSTLSLARKRVATKAVDVPVALYSNGISSLSTPADPYITMYQSGPGLQRHPPRDRSNRGRAPPRAEVERVLGAGNKPWSFGQTHGPSSGAGAFNLRLGQLADIRHSVRLLETLKEMKELGLRPNILTYNSAMELFAYKGFEDEAWALVDDMKAQGIMPDIETYKFLLQVRTTSPLFGGTAKILFWHTGCSFCASRSYLVRAQNDGGGRHQAYRGHIRAAYLPISS